MQFSSLASLCRVGTGGATAMSTSGAVSLLPRRTLATTLATTTTSTATMTSGAASGGRRLTTPGAPPTLHAHTALPRDVSAYDALLVVTPNSTADSLSAPWQRVLGAAAASDATFASDTTFHHVGGGSDGLPAVPGARLVFSPTGPLERDYDDVRRYADAAAAAVRRAKRAGARRPLLLVEPPPPHLVAFEHHAAVATLGALQALYESLQARESAAALTDVEPVDTLGVVSEHASEAVRVAAAIEVGKRLARDLGGADPERMAPPRFAEFVAATLAPYPSLRVEVVSDADVLARDYPLLWAVHRGARHVARHEPRVVRIHYRSSSPAVARSLFLAGKGVTMDTGGADIKTGGFMRGMSRDKCGAANVAGFMATVGELAPAELAVTAELGLVRNSVGSEMFVCDEILTGHSGVRVKIGNTDAEGRLVLADLLSHLRQRALTAPHPHVLSMATLTGHAARSVGAYTVAMDNGPARREGEGAQALQAAGFVWGDGHEVSHVRRDDFAAIASSGADHDCLQISKKPERGHQYPAAFLARASGLDAHGLDAADKGGVCIPFTHLDIAGSGCEGDDFFNGKPTAAGLTALVGNFVLPNIDV